MFDSTGSLIQDEGEKVLIEDEWIKVKPVDKEKYLKSKEFWRNRQWSVERYFMGELIVPC